MDLNMAEEVKCTYSIRVTPRGVEPSADYSVSGKRETFHNAIKTAAIWLAEDKVTTIHKHYADPHRDSVIVAVFDRANGVV